MKPNQVVPAIAASEHDSNGRLIAIAYDSTPPLPAPTTNVWLVAVDGSDNALRAIAHASTQVAMMNACAIHLVNVQPWLSKEAAQSDLADRALGATARARSMLDAAGLPWRLHVAMGDAAEHILDMAAQLRASTIVMGSRGMNALESVVFGSVAYKTVHRSPVPVMVVP